jgi:hypothetical protein
MSFLTQFYGQGVRNVRPPLLEKSFQRDRDPFRDDIIEEPVLSKSEHFRGQPQHFLDGE